MERYELENSREFKAAKELEHALNDYGWNEKRFAIAVTTFHRTLQQTLFRSMVEVIKIMGSEGYGYDLRNRASHEICKKIVESGVLEDETIPIYLKWLRHTELIFRGGIFPIKRKYPLPFLFTDNFKIQKIMLFKFRKSA